MAQRSDPGKRVKTEEVIIEAMQRLMKGRTTFMISHRLDTLASCDMQVEIEQGWSLFDVDGAREPPVPGV